MMEYKGYIAKLEFDDSVNVFHGRVININDVITFEATSVKGLWKELKDSVNDYLDLCAERGEKPDRPYSGQFRLRLDPDLHRQVAIAAQMEGETLNSFVVNTLEHAVNGRQ